MGNSSGSAVGINLVSITGCCQILALYIKLNIRQSYTVGPGRISTYFKLQT